jgi:hypothetical protein
MSACVRFPITDGKHELLSNARIMLWPIRWIIYKYIVYNVLLCLWRSHVLIFTMCVMSCKDVNEFLFGSFDAACQPMYVYADIHLRYIASMLGSEYLMRHSSQLNTSSMERDRNKNYKKLNSYQCTHRGLIIYKRLSTFKIECLAFDQSFYEPIWILLLYVYN